MINLDAILMDSIERNASDIHLIAGRKPMIRVAKVLQNMEEYEELKEEDMYEMYDYFVRGNVNKDEEYRKTKKLDFSYEFARVRFRGNISSADDIPIATLRIIKNDLPKFEDLGIPDVVRRMMYQPQGLILVTGKTNSGKTTTLNALINEINMNERKKILSLEKPVEFKHTSQESLIIQK